MRGSLSFIIRIGIAVGMFWWIPQTREVPFSGLMLYAPDAGWLLLLNGALALIALIVSLGVMIFFIQQSGTDQNGKRLVEIQQEMQD